MAKNFLKLMTDTKSQIQEAQRAWNGINTSKIQQHKTTTLRHAIVKLQITKDKKKKKNLERSQQGNKSISYREMKIIIADFRSHASKKDWIEIFKLIKENPIKLEFYMQEIMFQNRGRNKDFLRKRKPERIYCQ